MTLREICETGCVELMVGFTCMIQSVLGYPIAGICPYLRKELEAGEKSLKLPRFLWAKSFFDTQLDAIP